MISVHDFSGNTEFDRLCNHDVINLPEDLSLQIAIVFSKTRSLSGADPHRFPPFNGNRSDFLMINIVHFEYKKTVQVETER